MLFGLFKTKKEKLKEARERQIAEHFVCECIPPVLYEDKLIVHKYYPGFFPYLFDGPRYVLKYK